MFLRSVTRISEAPEMSYPFHVPAIQEFHNMDFTSPVTLFVGENGTGKSTFLEAIAASIGSITVGEESVETDPTLHAARRLAKILKLTWSKKTKRGFFLRSEDFFSYAKRMSRLRAEMLENIAEVEATYRNRSTMAKNLAMLPYKGSLYELDRRYGESLDAHSHGESFFELFKSRIVPDGVYLLDEPEAALSPMSQFSFLALIKEAVKDNCQFVIATHSPILMAYPEAQILSFDSLPIQSVLYEDLEHVAFMSQFLRDPNAFLRRL